MGSVSWTSLVKEMAALEKTFKLRIPSSIVVFFVADQVGGRLLLLMDSASGSQGVPAS